MKKIFSLMLVLLIAVLVSGCSKQDENVNQNQNAEEQVSQETHIQDEISQTNFQLPDMNQDNWQTYTDEAWGFSIKFPKELYYKVHTQGESYPGEECNTCGNGGQLLIISDQEEIGIQDYGLNENVHIVVTSTKWNNSSILKEFLNNKYEKNDELGGVEFQENSKNDYLIKTYFDYERYPYNGEFYNKHLLTYRFDRHVVDNNWRYSINGGVTFLVDEEDINQKEVELVESIISTFELAE